MMLLRREFTKLIHQKRSYVGWIGLLAVPLLVTLALYLNRNNHHHDNGPGGVISLAMHNGLLMPVAAITLLMKTNRTARIFSVIRSQEPSTRRFRRSAALATDH